MAKVQVQVAGGGIQEKVVGTIGELAKAVNAVGYQATVNGEPQSEGYALTDYEFVSFAKPVKAGQIGNVLHRGNVLRRRNGVEKRI